MFSVRWHYYSAFADGCQAFDEQIFAEVSEYFDTFSAFATIQTIPQYIVVVKFLYTTCASSTEIRIKISFFLFFDCRQKIQAKCKELKNFYTGRRKRDLYFIHNVVEYNVK